MENKKKVEPTKSVQSNKQIIILLAAIAAVIAITTISLKTVKKEESKKEIKVDVASVVANAETKVIYVENSKSGKCKDCNKIKKYLDEQKVKYETYDVADYTEAEYKEMLRTIEINPDDFGYPAVIYINEGKLYSNVINLTDTKPVAEFIKTYELKKIK